MRGGKNATPGTGKVNDSIMSKVFSRFKARDYEFRNDDGTTDRKMIVIYAGTQRVGFLEYEHARAFAHLLLSLTDRYDEERGGTQ